MQPLTRRRRERSLLANLRQRRLPGRRPGLLGALGAADQWLLRQLRTRAHGPRLDLVMRGLGYAGEWSAIWVALGLGAAAIDRERRPRFLAAAAVGPAAVLVNYAVKVAVGRERPLIEDHPPLARAPSKLSFPSAHATSSLAASTALARVAPEARLPLYGLAGAICACRPYLGMHYPSDVLAGAALGAVLGRLVPGLDGPPDEGAAAPAAGREVGAA
ncbi:MAG TPA: phosphatase PAP2 family protein [Solirubrobacterales bacterium]|jgi:undecaprenyl-diphosphatase